MIEALGWLLAVLESISVAQHAGPRVRRLAQRARYALLHRRASALVVQRDPYVSASADDRVAGECYKLGHCFVKEATGLEETAFLERHRHSPEALHVIYHVNPETQTMTLQGYFVLLPLSRTGLTAISKGHVEAGRHLRDTDICRSFQQYAALYVSVVYARSPNAQVATVRALTAAVFAQSKSHPGIEYVFVRPTTTLGRRAFFRLTGIPPSPDDRIERVALSRLAFEKPIDSQRRSRPRQQTPSAGTVPSGVDSTPSGV